MRISKLVVAALALAAAASPARAAGLRSHVQNARLGAIRAAYSYRDTTVSGAYDHARLRIWNSGRLIVNHPFRFALVPPVGRALLIRQLDASRLPEVIVNQYTGGTHC